MALSKDEILDGIAELSVMVPANLMFPFSKSSFGLKLNERGILA